MEKAKNEVNCMPLMGNFMLAMGLAALMLASTALMTVSVGLLVACCRMTEQQAPLIVESIGKLILSVIALSLVYHALLWYDGLRQKRNRNDICEQEVHNKSEEVHGETEISKFNESQQLEIQWGRDFGLSGEQLALYAKPEFSADQMSYIRYGLEDSLPIEKIELYAKPEFSAMQMREIWIGCEENKTLEQVASLAKPELTPLQIRERRKGLH